MTFAQKLQNIQKMLSEDSKSCITLISSSKFISQLFYSQLLAFSKMIEQALQKKGVSSNDQNDGKSGLRPHVIVACYSVLIMRWSAIKVKQQKKSILATTINQTDDSIYNSKLAIEILTKIYKNLTEEDILRPVIAGLLLKINGFKKNYKMIVKDIIPSYVSSETLDIHFEGIRNQCPNLFEAQLIRYRAVWSKYLKFKSISLEDFKNLFNSLIQSQTQQNHQQNQKIMSSIDQQSQYIINRLKQLRSSNEVQRVNIEQLTSSIDELYVLICTKIKDSSVTKGRSVQSHAFVQYSSQQIFLQNYLIVYRYLLEFVEEMISSIGMNWLRKIKWIHNFTTTAFTNFDIRGSGFHPSIAAQYGKLFLMIIKLITTYLKTFKSGLFPSLSQFAISQTQYCISKLIEALLYNDYAFEQQAVSYQNYQKNRKHNQNKNKQNLIDTLQFSMKSLNINIHWDKMLLRLIPSLKNSSQFAQALINSGLVFLKQYFSMTENYDGAGRFILMLANARNSAFIRQRSNQKLMNQIKEIIYPGRQETKQGIQYFCDEYFQEFLKRSQTKLQQQSLKKQDKLNYFHMDQLQFSPQIALSRPIKKTESLQIIANSKGAVMQGWEDNFQQIKDIQNDNIGASIVKKPGSQLFYSVKQSEQKDSKNLNGDKIQAENIEDDILVPDLDI